MITTPSKYAFPTLESALDHLYTNPNVIFTAKSQRVFAYFREHRHLPPLLVIKEPMPNYNSILLPKNSPLTPSLKLFGMIATERGLQDTIFKKWFGDGLQKVNTEDTKVLSFGDIFMSFVIFSVAVIVSFIIFCCEKHSRKQQKTRPKLKTSKIPIAIQHFHHIPSKRHSI